MKKSTYKIMPIILAMMVIFSAVCLPSTQVMAATTGITSDGFKYTSYGTYVTITGYSGSNGAITIPSTIDNLPVTTIGDHAFDWCSGLTSVTITDSVTTIGTLAFLK